MLEARAIIFDYFNDPQYHSKDLDSLMWYLDTDTLVAWFVDEGYVDYLQDEEAKFINEYYEKHC